MVSRIVAAALTLRSRSADAPLPLRTLPTTRRLESGSPARQTGDGLAGGARPMAHGACHNDREVLDDS